MVSFLSKIKEKFSDLVSTREEMKMLSDADEDYLELETEKPADGKKITIRTFSLTDFTDLKPILDHLREGLTIALINIKPLKDKDMVELKRAINKLKKTTDAINGDIAGFGEDYIIVTPAIAQVHRGEEAATKKKAPKEEELDEDF